MLGHITCYPQTIVIRPPIFDPIAAYGIGGMAVLVAIVWGVLFSRHNSGHVVVLAVAVIMLMALSAMAALSGQLSRFDSFPRTNADHDRIGFYPVFCGWAIFVRT